jgi:hypothetical protein
MAKSAKGRLCRACTNWLVPGEWLRMVTGGVPDLEISAQGSGDTYLLVPTGLRVRKSQNRHIVIVAQ